jgi:hypothetical protein
VKGCSPSTSPILFKILNVLFDHLIYRSSYCTITTSNWLVVNLFSPYQMFFKTVCLLYFEKTINWNRTQLSDLDKIWMLQCFRMRYKKISYWESISVVPKSPPCSGRLPSSLHLVILSQLRNIAQMFYIAKRFRR